MVTAAGPGVRPGLVGRRVAAVTKTGGWLTHVLLPAAHEVPVPGDLDPAAIEAVVVNGVTAWQMLHRKARVPAGGTILVHGANSDPDLAGAVRRLAPRGVDTAFGHLGGASFRRSFDLLAPGGTLVAYGTATQLDGHQNQVLTFLGIFGLAAPPGA